MTAPFAIGTKVRLTGEGWDGIDSVPASGTEVTITLIPGEVEPGSSGGFVWPHRSGEVLDWYVSHDGFWAAEAVEEPFTLPRSRQDIQDALDALKADSDLDGDPWGIGFDKGYASALEWVLKAEPWTVAD